MNIGSWSGIVLFVFWLLSQTMGFAVSAVSSTAERESPTSLAWEQCQAGTVNIAYDASSQPCLGYDAEFPPATQRVLIDLVVAVPTIHAYDSHPITTIGTAGAARAPPVAEVKLLAAEGAGARLALPGVRQVDYSWGALNNYSKGGQMTALEHINYRHAFESGFSDVSRFAEGTSVRDIQSFVDQASRYGNVTAQGANGFKMEYNLGRTIGTGQAGEAASGIRVFIRNGQVQEATGVRSLSSYSVANRQ